MDVEACCLSRDQAETRRDRELDQGLGGGDDVLCLASLLPELGLVVLFAERLVGRPHCDGWSQSASQPDRGYFDVRDGSIQAAGDVKHDSAEGVVLMVCKLERRV